MNSLRTTFLLSCFLTIIISNDSYLNDIELDPSKFKIKRDFVKNIPNPQQDVTFDVDNKILRSLCPTLNQDIKNMITSLLHLAEDQRKSIIDSTSKPLALKCFVYFCKNLKFEDIDDMMDIELFKGKSWDS